MSADEQFYYLKKPIPTENTTMLKTTMLIKIIQIILTIFLGLILIALKVF